ncbi:right-handed parallel beta-helix repeat-containing protein [Candidatus Peregrinibacteria bacterium]|nr:MAG: right-handed parallel beta-helix repeat-containing protein [Candidatus Peregrinibacteria bacterium]
MKHLVLTNGIIGSMFILFAFLIMGNAQANGACDAYLSQADFDPQLAIFDSLEISKPGIYCLQEDISIAYPGSIANHLNLPPGIGVITPAIKILSPDVSLEFDGHIIDNKQRFDHPEDDVIAIQIRYNPLPTNGINDQTVIRDGQINGFSRGGIDASYSDTQFNWAPQPAELLIMNMIISESNDAAITVSSGINITIEQNRFENNAAAIQMSNVENVQIISNQIETSTVQFPCCRGVVDIDISESSNVEIINNTLQSDEFVLHQDFTTGIQTNFVDNYAIKNNTINGYYYGIYSVQDAIGSIEDNNITSDIFSGTPTQTLTTHGLAIYQPSGVDLIGNDLAKVEVGIELINPPLSALPSTVTNNRICLSSQPIVWIPVPGGP